MEKESPNKYISERLDAFARCVERLCLCKKPEQWEDLYEDYTREKQDLEKLYVDLKNFINAKSWTN